jgi:hypothetical protein
MGQEYEGGITLCEMILPYDRNRPVIQHVLEDLSSSTIETWGWQTANSSLLCRQKDAH